LPEVLPARAPRGSIVLPAGQAVLPIHPEPLPAPGGSTCWGTSTTKSATATTQILLVGSEIGTGGFDQPDSGDGQRLWNLAARIPSAQRYTRIFRGQRQLIDHLLVGYAIIVQVVADGDVTTVDADFPSITEHPNRHRNAPGSDHRPVLVEFAL